LEIKVLKIIDARCDQEVWYFNVCFKMITELAIYININSKIL